MSSVDELSKQVAGLNSEIKALKKEIQDLQTFKRENAKAKREVSAELERRTSEGSRFRHYVKRAKYAETLAKKVERRYSGDSAANLLANFDGIKNKIDERIEKLNEDIRIKSGKIEKLNDEIDKAKDEEPA